MQVLANKQSVSAVRATRQPLRVACVARVSSRVQQPQQQEQQKPVMSLATTASIALAPFIAHVGSAAAADGEFGILEGRTVALLHPAAEFALLAISIYAAYLGLQYKRQRELGDEIRALKATAGEGSPEVAQKEKERKDLMSGNYRQKHYEAGALLLGGGVGIAIEGCINTWMRTGKLFPGPHLFAGAAIVLLWAVSAALVPYMQKGDQNARNAHIALNSINMLLFISQVPTGLEIVDKVFQFTTWP